MKITRDDIRNVAIIAHVDHGKTTLVDELLKQSGVFRDNQEVAERVMDSNDIERERGITILSKNTAVTYGNTKINIIDTPGHADFGGEVERVLKMVNGVILVVDAFEGPMPQTKFVLKKALELNLAVIVCVNKCDRPEARPDEVVDEVLELLIELDANEDQLDCPFVFASAKSGYATLDSSAPGTDMKPLFDTIIDYIPAPTGDPDAGVQMLVSTIDYNEYVGRIGVGKVDNGVLKINEDLVIVNEHDPDKLEKVRIGKLFEYEGLNKIEVKEAQIGSIVAVSGIADVQIGDTLCSPENPDPIPFQKISEPTISMTFMVNDSPLAGKEGKFVTSRHLRDRLFRELNTDVSLRVEETDTTEAFKVSGRGELHLSVLIENMRREGFEFAVSKAEVIYKEDERGKKLEPFEIAYIDVPDEFSGTIINMLNQRKGELQGMAPTGNGTTRLEFSVPSRGLIGFRGDFMTATKGTGIINTIFDEYLPYKGDMNYRSKGSLIAYESGTSITYGLFNAQERGTLFIGPGEQVYAGMVVGENPRAEDIEVNVCKKKQLTNTRSSGADDALKLSPPKIMSLEQALDFIDTDELLEITPKSFRIRKKILDHTLRYRANRK
ncbi:MAG: translational GTPase TypA [Clostridiales bacterium]|nr:translational GTPase TypA [Clostridiales bacterium]